MHTIAVLGLGRMGQGIAARFIKNGYTTIVWNRSRDKAAPLLEAGAVWADTPAIAAGGAGVVLSMLSDDAASTAAWFGRDGALDAMAPGSFVIECSTISAKQAGLIAAAAAERSLRYIDCPVTGLPEVAAAGKLTLLVGADPDNLESIRPVLTCFSETIRHFGAVGTGTAYKLMINLMGAVQIAALAEGLALAERLGLDKDTVIAAIENSAAASPQVIRFARKMAEKNYAAAPDFTLSLRHKDAVYGVRLAHHFNSPVPLGQSAAAWFEIAGKKWPGRDEAAVIEVMAAPS